MPIRVAVLVTLILYCSHRTRWHQCIVREETKQSSLRISCYQCMICQNIFYALMGLPMHTYPAGKIYSQINHYLERVSSQLLWLIGVESILHLGAIANDQQNPDSSQGTLWISQGVLSVAQTFIYEFASQKGGCTRWSGNHRFLRRCHHVSCRGFYSLWFVPGFSFVAFCLKWLIVYHFTVFCHFWRCLKAVVYASVPCGLRIKALAL